MSILQKQVIQSLDGLSEDNLQFLFDMIQRFMKPGGIGERIPCLAYFKQTCFGIGNIDANGKCASPQ